MKHRIALCFILMACMATKNFGQTPFRDSPDAFLGQKKPGEQPVVFGKGLLVSDTGYFPMGRISISKDGKEFIYASNTSWYSSANLRVKTISFTNGRWGAPKIINEHFGAPTLSADNNTLYLQGPRVNDRGTVYVAYRSDTGWSKPVVFITRPYGLYNFMPTDKGPFYVGSNGNGGSKTDFSTYDISVMPSDLNDSSIASLGQPVNTDKFEGDLFIAPDESYLILSAKETPTYESELWISFHRPDGSWTAPLSLGDEVNKGAAHRFGQYVSPDNKYLFFTKGTNEKDCRFYWMRFDTLLARLRRQALQQ